MQKTDQFQFYVEAIMAKNIIDLISIGDLMDDTDLMFERILSQAKKQDNAVLVLDMLEHNTIIFIKQCGYLLPAERLKSFKKKIKKLIKNAIKKSQL